MRIALLSCTRKKKDYPCRASEMYAESPRFALAYQYAKMTCDRVFILSAKYGLIPEERVIEPYPETLVEKSRQQRKTWTHHVLGQMDRLCYPEEDSFLILAGTAYHEFLLPSLRVYDLPLKGVSLESWIPVLHRLIMEAEKPEPQRSKPVSDGG